MSNPANGSSEPQVSIGACTSADLPDILEIENVSYPRPWTLKQFQHELAAPYSELLVLRRGAETVAYICYWLAAGEMHILNIAVAAVARRSGLAERLLDHALQQAVEAAAEVACLEVRTGNLAAVRLYRKFGFVEDSVRSGYYADGEDALLMSLDLTLKPSKGD